jgi:glycosyltransferase involved in cell wall biosynthesis
LSQLSTDPSNWALAVHPVGGSGDWHAGVTYLCGLLQALRESPARPRLLLLSPTEPPNPDLTALVDEVACWWPLFPPRGTALWAARGLARRCFGTDVVGDHLLRKRGVGVVAFGDVSTYGNQILSTSLPYIAWLPDFQHVHHPDLFSLSERRGRDATYKSSAERATRVLLMSEAVRRDFCIFAPDLAHKARVLRPVGHIPDAAFGADPRVVVDRYSLPSKFFLLPNHLWKHKNHLTVAKALRLALEEAPDMTAVCTGGLIDYRWPAYLGELLLHLSMLGVRERFILLGPLPRLDVLSLMRQAVGVVSASVFEGFGLVIEEARSLGKAIIVSDIPAHREQDPGEDCVFFEPGDVENLAHNMLLLWKDGCGGVSVEREAEARRVTSARRQQCSVEFLSIMREIRYP